MIKEIQVTGLDVNSFRTCIQVSDKNELYSVTEKTKCLVTEK